MSNTDINAIFAPAPDRVKSMEKEVEGYRAICKEFLDGSEETTNPECLRAYVDQKTDELSTANEQITNYEETLDEIRDYMKLIGHNEVEVFDKIVAGDKDAGNKWGFKKFIGDFDHFRFEKADIDNDTDLFNAYKEVGYLSEMKGHRNMTYPCFQWTNFDNWLKTFKGGTPENPVWDEEGYDDGTADIDKEAKEAYKEDIEKEDDWWKPFYNSFEEAIVGEYGDQSIQAKRYGFGVFKPKVTLPTPLIPYPRQNIIGKYPDFAESVEKEVEITKEYFKNNCECSKEAVKEFANTHNHSNEMVDYIKNLPDDKFDRAYWGYTQLFKTAGDKEKVKIVGNILNTEGGIELMRASFYLMCWDTKKAGILIDSYRRLVEFYWDGVGTWRA